MPRSTTFRRPAPLLAALALAVLAVAAALAVTDASGQAAPRTFTLTELERGATFTHVRNTKGAPRTSNLQGDLLAFTNPLADAAGARVGKLSATCTTTTGARSFTKSTITCFGVLALKDGSLMVQTNSRIDAASTGAIVGGTGAYAGARGQFASVPGRAGSVDTITLVG
jgi:hypothetical protein